MDSLVGMNISLEIILQLILDIPKVLFKPDLITLLPCSSSCSMSRCNILCCYSHLHIAVIKRFSDLFIFFALNPEYLRTTVFYSVSPSFGFWFRLEFG